MPSLFRKTHTHIHTRKKNAKPFYSQVRHWRKVFTGCLLLLNWFCPFLIQTVRSPKLQLGDASFNASCYRIQRLNHCMSFVVEWFIGMQWAAFGFGERWTAWLCLSLCCLLSAFLAALYPFPLYLPFPAPLHVLKFFHFLSLFPYLQFSFFLCVSESPSSPVYHIYLFKSLFQSLKTLPTPALPHPETPGCVCRQGEYLFHRIPQEALSFLFLGVGAWQHEQQWAWPLGLVCGSCDRHNLAVGSMNSEMLQ